MGSKEARGGPAQAPTTHGVAGQRSGCSRLRPCSSQLPLPPAGFDFVADKNDAWTRTVWSAISYGYFLPCARAQTPVPMPGYDESSLQTVESVKLPMTTCDASRYM